MDHHIGGNGAHATDRALTFVRYVPARRLIAKLLNNLPAA